MTVKSFQKLNNATRTHYSVFKGENEEPCEFFTVDYLEKDVEFLSDMIRKREKYGKATIKYVDTGKDSTLWITCIIK